MAKKEKLSIQKSDLRKQAEGALQESELKYRSLIECSSDAIFCVNEKGEYKFTNHLFSSTFGKSPDYFIGKTFWDIYPKEHADQRYEVIKRVFQTGKSESIDVEVPLPDKTLYFYATDDPIKDETGKVILVLTHAADITDRKRAEVALLESDEKHKRMIANISDVIAIMDKDGTLKYKSPNIEKWFGWKPEDLVGTDGWETVHPDDLVRIKKEFFTILENDNSVASVEYKYKCKDGSYKLIALTAVNLTNDPIIGGVLMNYRDITERKQAEKALQESEEMFRLLFNSGKDYIAVHLTGNDGQPMNFIQVNDAACEIFGYTREEMLKLSPQDVDTLDSSGQMPALIKKLIENKYVLFETEMISKKGQRIPMEVSLTLFQLNDNQATMCVARNITDRKLAEEALRNQNKSFSQVLNGLDAVVYVVDMKTYEIVFINKYGQNIWGDILGKICWQTIQSGQSGPCEYCTNSKLFGPDGDPTEGVVWEFQNPRQRL